jgi:hypothetical protein
MVDRKVGGREGGKKGKRKGGREGGRGIPEVSGVAHAREEEQLGGVNGTTAKDDLVC